MAIDLITYEFLKKSVEKAVLSENAEPRGKWEEKPKEEYEKGDYVTHNNVVYVYAGTGHDNPEPGNGEENNPWQEIIGAKLGIGKKTAEGGEIFNDYENNQALNTASHAEGQQTQATGDTAHAEGYQTQATGDYSHSEGYATVAQADYSHAEGRTSVASGETSHAEGYNTKAIGKMSHSEGNTTIAEGNYSHSEGLATKAFGNNSHTEGSEAKVNAKGTNGHAEGYATIVDNVSAHAEGHQTQANGPFSHAENQVTKANGQASHAEGIETIAQGYGSHAEGEKTQTIGKASHTEGIGTIANGAAQHVEGKYNSPMGAEYVHIVGQGTSDTNRKNIHVLKNTGEAWFGGRIYIGDKNEELATINHEHPVVGEEYKMVDTDLLKLGVTAEILNDIGDSFVVIEDFCEPYNTRIGGSIYQGTTYSINYTGYIEFTVNGIICHDKYDMIHECEGKLWIDGELKHTWNIDNSAENYTYKGMVDNTIEFSVNIADMYFSSIKIGEPGPGLMTPEHLEKLNSLPGKKVLNGGEIFNAAETASGTYSHAEGEGTIASGRTSHSEGYKSKAISTGSHAEGVETIAGTRAYNIIGISENYTSNDASNYFIIDGLYESFSSIYDNLTEEEKVFSLKISNNYNRVGKMYAIEKYDKNSTKVYVLLTDLSNGNPFTNSADKNLVRDNNGEITLNSKLNSFILCERPEIGTKDFGSGAHAEGYGNKALMDYSHAEGVYTTVCGRYGHAEGNGTIAYHNAHAEGNDGQALGYNSHAEGHSTTASGLDSHSEGVHTTASGTASHAEGDTTKATGEDSHSEGRYTKSNGMGSHSEGINTIANGKASHVEGERGRSHGDYNHIEGVNGRAWGSQNHVEGVETWAGAEGAEVLITHVEGHGTRSNATWQHVQGKFNLPDSTKAHIVGNGSNDSKRSNAHTLDWNGNAWFAGDVTCTYNNKAYKMSDIIKALIELGKLS